MHCGWQANLSGSSTHICAQPWHTDKAHTSQTDARTAATGAQVLTLHTRCTAVADGLQLVSLSCCTAHSVTVALYVCNSSNRGIMLQPGVEPHRPTDTAAIWIREAQREAQQMRRTAAVTTPIPAVRQTSPRCAKAKAAHVTHNMPEQTRQRQLLADPVTHAYHTLCTAISPHQPLDCSRAQSPTQIECRL